MAVVTVEHAGREATLESIIFKSWPPFWGQLLNFISPLTI
jgi:hypothetical protein